MQANTTKPTKRIEYMDALRGLTMILVVFAHVEMTSFGYIIPTYINSLFISFFMPLFFWVSGFMAYKAGIEWNWPTWWKMSKKKSFILLVPTFVVGLIYTYAYFNADFKEFITHNGKLGYWFTIVLLEIFLVVYTTNTILYNGIQQIHKKRMFIALILLSGGMFVAKIPLKMNPTLNEIGNILSLHHTFNYFQYFAFGYICSMYKEEFRKILESKYFAAIIIVLFASLFYAKRSLIGANISDGMNIWKMFDIIAEMLIGYLGLLIVYNTFKTYQDSFTADKKIGRALQYIGKKTLDIYLLHYFFLPSLPQIGDFLLTGNNATLELIIGGFISLVVIGICLIISKILRTSPVLIRW
ncbi:MAG: acyltransferase [Bacteroidaceae bacterium]|nr:acyltransferase [Bacteroidaceae bacterium]